MRAHCRVAAHVAHHNICTSLCTPWLECIRNGIFSAGPVAGDMQVVREPGRSRAMPCAARWGLLFTFSLLVCSFEYPPHANPTNPRCSPD